MTQVDAPALSAKLRRVAEYERGLRVNPVTRLVRRIGGTRAFAGFYRKYGPKADPWLVRRSAGRWSTRVLGFPALLLTTVGARTGEPRVTPLLYVRDGDDFAVVGTNFGQPRHPGWTANLLAHPEATIEVGPEAFAVTAEPAGRSTFDRLWPQFVGVYPGYEKYLPRRGDLAPRMFLLHPTG